MTSQSMLALTLAFILTGCGPSTSNSSGSASEEVAFTNSQEMAASTSDECRAKVDVEV